MDKNNALSSTYYTDTQVSTT